MHNFVVSIIDFIGTIIYAYLSYKIYPLKLIKVRMIFFPIFVLFLPMMLSNISSPYHIMFIQLFIFLLGTDIFPAEAILFVHFPIFKRFTYSSFIYALSRAAMYVITSFGLIYLIDKFGNYGALIIFIPMIIGFWYGVLHFDKLEATNENR